MTERERAFYMIGILFGSKVDEIDTPLFMKMCGDVGVSVELAFALLPEVKQLCETGLRCADERISSSKI